MRRVFPLLLLLALLLAGCQGEAAPAVSYDLDQVPAYAGEPYVVINDNQPFFGEEEYTTEAFETYSALDGLGRCGTAYACVGEELMPAGERESISSVREEQSAPQPSSRRIFKMAGLGVAFTAKYSLKPGFQAKAAFNRRAFSLMPFSSYRWKGVGYCWVMERSCSAVTKGRFMGSPSYLLLFTIVKLWSSVNVQIILCFPISKFHL